MKHKKIFSLASVAAMLASWVTVPVNAASVNQYEISCETLTSAVTVGDTVVAPGTVAVTMSIDGNTGFQSNTLALQLDENYEVLKTADGNPVLQTGEVLEDFHAFAAETDNKICVAVASENESSKDGKLFTVYCTYSLEGSISLLKNTETTEVAVIVPPSQETRMFTTTTSYRVGDVNGDDWINAVDAANILVGINKFYENHSELKKRSYVDYKYFREEAENGKNTELKACFPNAPGSYGVNCVDTEEAYDKWLEDRLETRVIDKNDSDEILEYAAQIGSGGTYKESKIKRVGKTYNPNCKDIL